MKEEEPHRLREQTHCQGNRGGEGLAREFRMDIHTTVFKTHKQQGPTV